MILQNKVWTVFTVSFLFAGVFLFLFWMVIPVYLRPGLEFDLSHQKEDSAFRSDFCLRRVLTDSRLNLVRSWVTWRQTWNLSWQKWHLTWSCPEWPEGLLWPTRHLTSFNFNCLRLNWELALTDLTWSCLEWLETWHVACSDEFTCSCPEWLET